MMSIKDDLINLINAIDDIRINKFKYNLVNGKPYGIKSKKKIVQEALTNILKANNEYDSEWIDNLIKEIEDII